MTLFCSLFPQKYRENFKDYGYDDTSFVIGMKEQDLLDIGISNRGHRKKLLANIEQLPPEEMDHHVPVCDCFDNCCIQIYLPNIFQCRIDYELKYSLRGAKQVADYLVYIL